MTDTTHDWAEQVERDMRMDHLITRDEAQAMVAAALTEAAQAVKQDAENDDISHGAAQWVADTILSLITPDAQTALDRALAAERDALKEAVDEVTEYAKRHEAERDALAEKLDIAIKGLEESREEIDDYIRWEYPSDHPVHERYRKRDFAANPARITLAEIKDTPHD